MDVVSSPIRWYPPNRLHLVITCKTTSVVKTLKFYNETWLKDDPHNMANVAEGDMNHDE
jgi:hypothetical protein